VLEALRRRGIDYRGVLYGGLIVTEHGIKVLEFNCRFGDPETQAILPRLDSDLLEACLAAANGALDTVELRWKPQPCVSVVMASAGYPATSSKGDVISGLSSAAALPDVSVYHAGTAVHDGDIVTAGGRVLAVSALGEHFGDARERAYASLARISFPGMQYRADIAERAVRAETGEISLFPAVWAD
jgi:phosphoribosylamine--glycine ligase